MISFTVRRIDLNLELELDISQVEGFLYKTKRGFCGEIKEVMIINPDIITALISCSFDKNYKKILKLYLTSIQGDNGEESEGNLMLALNEIERLKSIILQKYSMLLKKKEMDKLLKRLELLYGDVNNKIIDFRLIREQEMVNTNDIEPEKSLGR